MVLILKWKSSEVRSVYGLVSEDFTILEVYWNPSLADDEVLYSLISALSVRFRIRPPHTKKEESPVYDTQLFWVSGECGVHPHYHYSQVHFDLKWSNLLESHWWVK